MRKARAICAAFLISAVFLPAPFADAANKPCSGRKGGIARCQGDTFICNDGSVSASKRSCSGRLGAGALGIMGGSSRSPQMGPSSSKDCSCRDGRYCTGPRGGRYCLTDSGKKSYLRN